MKQKEELVLRISKGRSRLYTALLYVISISAFFLPLLWLLLEYAPPEPLRHWFLWYSVCLGTATCGSTLVMIMQPAHIFYGNNNDKISKKYTLKVINTAKNWLIFYDYGLNSDTNIYSSDRIQEAMFRQLAENPELRVSFIFKKSKKEVQQLKLIKALQQWQKRHPKQSTRLSFFYERDRDAPEYSDFNYDLGNFPYHYKVNDQNYAYLTQHNDLRRTIRYVYSGPWAGLHVMRVLGCLDFHQTVLDEHNGRSQ